MIPVVEVIPSANRELPLECSVTNGTVEIKDNQIVRSRTLRAVGDPRETAFHHFLQFLRNNFGSADWRVYRDDHTGNVVAQASMVVHNLTDAEVNTYRAFCDLLWGF
jgi:hypothetical protein